MMELHASITPTESHIVLNMIALKIVRDASTPTMNKLLIQQETQNLSALAIY